MKCLLRLLFWCMVGLVLGNHMKINTYNKHLQARDLTRTLQVVARSIDEDSTPLSQTYLVRRGTGDSGQRKPVSRAQVEGNGNVSRSQARGSSSPRNQSGRANPRSKSSIESRGPAEIWASNSAFPGDHRDIQRQHVRQGQRGSLHTGYHAGTIAGGEVIGSPPLNAAQQPTENHPLKAEAKGRTAIGRVVAPPGGRGNIRTEDSTGVSNLNVLGGSTMVSEAYTPGRDDAKVEASVTRGGKAQAGAQPYDGLRLNIPTDN